MAASITTWIRLEPLDQSSDLEASLTAPIADPLWLLHRQWQIGELDAQRRRLAHRRHGPYEQAPLSRLSPGPIRRRQARLSLTTTREGCRSSRWSRPRRVRGLPDQHRRLAAETGLHLLRLCAPRGFGSSRRGVPDPLPGAPAAIAARRRPTRSGAEAAILLDGRGARRRPACGASCAPHRRRARWPTDEPAGVVPTGDRPDVSSRSPSTWLAWYEELVVEPAATTPPTVTPPGWHAAPVRVPVRQRSPRRRPAGSLSAPTSYDDGHLDWPDLSVATGRPGAPRGHAARRRVDVSIPVPLAYAGMPAHRHWEIEDSRVNFAGIEAGSTDLVRMLLDRLRARLRRRLVHRPARRVRSDRSSTVDRRDRPRHVRRHQRRCRPPTRGGRRPSVGDVPAAVRRRARGGTCEHAC